MKKILMQLGTFLFAFFLFATPTFANYNLSYSWSKDLGAASNYLYYDDTIKVSDGYVTVSIDDNYRGVMHKLNNETQEIVWELANDWGVYVDLTEAGDHYYALFFGTYDEYYGSYYVASINKDSGAIEDWVYLNTENYNDEFVDGEIFVLNNYIYVTIKTERSNQIFRIDPTGKETALEVTNSRDDIVDLINSLNLQYPAFTRIGYNSIDGLVWDLFETQLTAKEMSGIYDIFVSNLFDDENGNIYFVGDIYYSNKDIGYQNFCSNMDKKQGFIMKVNYTNELKDILIEKEVGPDSGEDEKYAGKHIVDYLNVEWTKRAAEGTSFFDISMINDDYILVTSYEDGNCTPIGYNRQSSSVKSNLIAYDPKGNVIGNYDVAKDLGVERVDFNHVLSVENEIYGQVFGYDADNNIHSYFYKYTINKTASAVNPETGDNVLSYILVSILSSVVLITVLLAKKFTNYAK